MLRYVLTLWRSGGCAAHLCPVDTGLEVVLDSRVDSLVQELFRLHDLNSNGLLEEVELIKLNKKIARLHRGTVDKDAVTLKYTTLFRTKLDSEGRAVPYATFRSYILDVLNDVEADEPGQEMILEQFILEAEAGRAAFRIASLQSSSDASFLSGISLGPQFLLEAA